MTTDDHTHPSPAHKAGCPVCNPDKTVPELNDAYRASKPLCKHDWVGDDDCAYCRIDCLRAALIEAREYILDNGDERTMAPVVQRIDDAAYDLRQPVETKANLPEVSHCDHGIPVDSPSACPSCHSQVKTSSDSARLDWALRNVSGLEWRRLGIEYSAGMTRDDLDKRIALDVPDEPLCDHGIPVHSPSACPSCHSSSPRSGDA